VARIAGVYLITALLLGVVCSISLALSALLARSTTSGVLAYLTVFALAAGTAIVFGLVTATTQQTVRLTSTCPPGSTDCQPYEYETSVARPDRTWWLLAPNPFAVLADSAPAGPVRRYTLPDGEVQEEAVDVDVLGSLSRSLHAIRATPQRVTTEYGTEFRVPEGVTGGPVWPLGLGINLALAGLGLWVTTVRLRTPTARLARGQRIA
jgi:hypothetical protein